MASSDTWCRRRGGVISEKIIGDNLSGNIHIRWYFILSHKNLLKITLFN